MKTTDRVLAQLRRPDAYPLFLTGAGISLASGIPTFRGTDPEAVWANDVLEKGTLQYFNRDPVGSWQWYLKRFEACLGAEPNAGHRALVDIEALVPRSLTVTQNVDGLHLKAGSKNVVEVHGAARRMRCKRRGCQNGAPKGSLEWSPSAFAEFKAKPCMETLPRCPVCNQLIRAHVLWFDEGYKDHDDYGIEQVFEALDKATMVMFIGTSFAVTVTNIVITQAYPRGIPMFTVDPVAAEDADIRPIREKSEEFLPRLASMLAKEKR